VIGVVGSGTAALEPCGDGRPHRGPGLQPPVDACLLVVEPDEAQHVRPLLYPADQALRGGNRIRAGLHRGLGDNERLAGEAPDLLHGRAVQAVERVRAGGAEVAGNPDPADVRVARVVRGQVKLRFGGDDVGVPHPDHVAGARRGEQAVDESPGGHELRGGGAGGAPRIPVTVHLVPEADRDRQVQRAHLLRELGDVAVAAAVRDRRDGGAVWFPDHVVERAVRPGVGRRLSVHRLVPGHVLTDQVRPDPRAGGEGPHRPERVRRPGSLHAQEFPARGVEQPGHVVGPAGSRAWLLGARHAVQGRRPAGRQRRREREAAEEPERGPRPHRAPSSPAPQAWVTQTAAADALLLFTLRRAPPSAA
jgi:hypothetical protein